VVIDRQAYYGISAHLERGGDQEQEWDRDALQGFEHDASSVGQTHLAARLAKVGGGFRADSRHKRKRRPKAALFVLPIEEGWPSIRRRSEIGPVHGRSRLAKAFFGGAGLGSVCSRTSGL